jgi:hypothetical protein
MIEIPVLSSFPVANKGGVIGFRILLTYFVERLCSVDVELAENQVVKVKQLPRAIEPSHDCMIQILGGP